MKHTKFFIFALVAAMTFSACGTDDTLQFYYPENGGTTGGGNTGGNTGGESTDKNNTNKNVATANMPQVVRNAIGGLEFPKLKNNGTSYAIVHMDNTTGMLNYSTEWDDNMKSQRWSCYTFHTGNTASNVKRWDAPQASANIHGIQICKNSGESQISQKTLLLQLKALTMVISALLLTANSI